MKLFFSSPAAGPGFPGYPLPPFSQAPQGNSTPVPPPSTSPPSDQGAGTGQSTGQGATPTTQETNTGGARGGLFFIPKNGGDGDDDGERQLESSSSEGQGSGSGASVLPAWAEEGARGGGVSTSSESSNSSSNLGVTTISSSHTDSDIRQRRLARLHSQPSTTQQSLSPLAEGDGEMVGTNRKEQPRTDDSNSGETEV